MRNVIVFLFLLSACAPIPLRREGFGVVVTRAVAPPACTFMGMVIGSQGGSWDGPYTANPDLAIGAMNDLRNRAAKEGANYVVLEDSRAGTTTLPFSALFFAGLILGVSQQTDVTHTGGAYNCPEATLRLAPEEYRKTFEPKPNSPFSPMKR